MIEAVLQDPWTALQQMAVHAIRAAVALALVPVFAPKIMPALVNGVLVLAIVFPVVATGAVQAIPAATLAITVVREAAVGGVIGLGFGAFCAALQTVGDLIDQQTGASFAQTVDPLSAAGSTSVTSLLLDRVFFAVLMLAGLLPVMADTLYLSYRVWPVGEPLPALGARVPLALIEYGAGVVNMALLLAGPVMLVLFVVDVCLALLGRSAPQLEIFQISLTLKPIVGLVVLALALPAMLERAVGFMQQLGAFLRSLMTGS